VSPHHPLSPQRIELNLPEVGQLFNTMDPSPFREKDLDHDAEEFIESWAREFPADAPLMVVLHLEAFPPEGNPQPMVTEAIHHYFDHRALLNQMEFRRLMQEGRRSLVVGLLFLGACLFLSDVLAHHFPGTLMGVLRESLTIGGWVAMWRPMEIYLYEWWPVKQHGKVLQKLSQVPVEVRQRLKQPG